MIKKWVAKAIVQKSISFLPGKQKINYLFQKHVTRGVGLTDVYFSDKLESAIGHLGFYQEHGKDEDEFIAFELGSGWYPVVPIALYLAGAKEIVSIDIDSHMNTERVKTAICKYQQWHSEGKLSTLEPYIRADRLERLFELESFSGSFEDLQSQINLKCVVGDARDTGYDVNTFDLICSNNTFEHIPKYILGPMLIEFQKILKPGGVMSHFIDMSDHFAHLDSTISIYNFLRYSEKQWDFIDNSIQPQNRMRVSEYESLYDDIGIDVLDKEVRHGDVDVVKQEQLHPDYQKYSIEELAVSHAYLISSKPTYYGISSESVGESSTQINK